MSRVGDGWRSIIVALLCSRIGDRPSLMQMPQILAEARTTHLIQITEVLKCPKAL